MTHQCSMLAMVAITLMATMPSCVLAEEDRVCSEFTLANSVRIVASGSFGSVAQVTCAPGYFFKGTNYTCSVHAQAFKWLGNGVCQVHTCGVLSVPNSLSISYSSSGMGSTATAICKPGYNLDGSKVCQAKSWSGTLQCRVIPALCGSLSVANSSSIDLNGAAINSVATISCKFNYFAQGKTVCMYDTTLQTGYWSGNGQCIHGQKLGKCEMLPTIMFAETLTINGYYKSSTLTVKCLPGYNVKPSKPLTCSVTGPEQSHVFKWNGSASCNRDLLACPPLHVANSASGLITDRYLGAVAYITCTPGFEYQAASGGVVCSHDTKTSQYFWSGSPACNAKVNLCKLPTIRNGANIAYSGHGPNGTLSFSCSPGYIQNNTAYCAMDNATKLWRFAGVASCDTLTNLCPLLAIKNAGAVAYSGRGPDSVVSFQCNLGYIKTNNATCKFNGDPANPTWIWVGETTCITKTCPALQVPNSASISMGDSTPDTVANVVCKPGFSYNTTGEVKCARSAKTGQVYWRNIPRCTPQAQAQTQNNITCAPLNISFSNISTTDGLLPGSVAMITCKTGYRLSADNVAVCAKLNGVSTWLNLPECRKDDLKSVRSTAVLGVALGGGAAGVVFFALLLVVYVRRRSATHSISSLHGRPLKTLLPSGKEAGGDFLDPVSTAPRHSTTSIVELPPIPASAYSSHTNMVPSTDPPIHVLEATGSSKSLNSDPIYDDSENVIGEIRLTSTLTGAFNDEQTMEQMVTGSVKYGEIEDTEDLEDYPMETHYAVVNGTNSQAASRQNSTYAARQARIPQQQGVITSSASPPANHTGRLASTNPYYVGNEGRTKLVSPNEDFYSPADDSTVGDEVCNDSPGVLVLGSGWLVEKSKAAPE